MIDRTHEASREPNLLLSLRGRQIPRFERHEHVSVERVGHIGIDEIVFDDPQPERDVVIHHTGLVEPLDVLIRELPQQVTQKLLVVRPEWSVYPGHIALDLSLRPSTRLDARHQRIAEPAGANSEGVRRDPQSSGQVSTAFDTLPAYIAVVIDGELALIGTKTIETTVETVQPLLVDVLLVVYGYQSDTGRPRHIAIASTLDTNVLAIAPKALEQDESRHNVAVTCRRFRPDDVALCQRVRDAIERFVRQLICVDSVSSIEVRDEPAPHLQVGLSL